jgi:hypothetical protein
MIRWLFSLVVVATSIVFFMSSSVSGAQGAMIQFRTGILEKQWNTIFGPDGKPVPDSSYLMLILAGENGVVDPPNCDGSPGGDDIQPTGNSFNCLYIHDMNKEIPVTPPGNIFASGIALDAKPEGALEEPAVNIGDKIYFRAFNHKDPAQATHYNDMISVEGDPMTVYQIPRFDGFALYTLVLAFGPPKPLCP